MKNTYKLLRIAAIALAVVFSFAACNTGTSSGGGNPDTWTQVTSWDQLNGEWMGSGVKQWTVQEYYYSQTLMDICGAGAKVTVASGGFIAVDTAAATNGLSDIDSIKLIFSGGNTSARWDNIKTELSKAAVYNNCTFDDKERSVTLEDEIFYDDIPGSITDHFGSGIEINQNGTKLKEPGFGKVPQKIFVKQ
jgi:hypothetical protein